jgi:hypothetical protein
MADFFALVQKGKSTSVPGRLTRNRIPNTRFSGQKLKPSAAARKQAY